MALNITPSAIITDALLGVDLLTQTTRVDVVKVLNQDTGLQVFAGARPMKAKVRETARVMRYPVETGASLSDHIVFNPTEIMMEMLIPSDEYTGAYVEIRQLWKSATALTVQTRTGIYKNMLIEEMPHEEDPDMFTAVPMLLRLSEAIQITINSSNDPVQVENYSPANPDYSGTVQRGLLAAVTAATSALSYLRAANVFGAKL